VREIYFAASTFLAILFLLNANACSSRNIYVDKKTGEKLGM